MKNNLRNL